MSKVTVYRFCVYDIRSDELVTSKRWGTREAIGRIGGQAIETTCVEVDPEAIRSDIEGLTEIGFAPSLAAIECPAPGGEGEPGSLHALTFPVVRRA